MAKATRTETRTTTEDYSIGNVNGLEAGDVVSSVGPFRAIVGRTETVLGKVDLELTEEEAVYLRTLLGRIVIGGTPSTGIFSALADAGIKNGNYRFVVGGVDQRAIRAEVLI